MEKLRTPTLALAALATLSGFATATTLQQQPRATTIKTSKSNSSERVATNNASLTLLKSKVSEVNDHARTFTVTVVFSAEKMMKGDFSRDTFRVGEAIDITYTQTPGGGPMEATTVHGSKSNGSERVAPDTASARLLKGKVTEVNNQAKTFTVAVVFSAAKLSKLPTVGQIVDITYTETPGGGPLEASNLNLSKSNIN
jgi:hypothetical protein